MSTNLEEMQTRLEIVWTSIINSEPETRLDLKRMYKAVEKVNIELSKEAINCRRIGKITPKYNELLTKFDEILRHLEQYVTFSILISS
jgi:hypothetical protein